MFFLHKTCPNIKQSTEHDKFQPFCKQYSIFIFNC